MKGKSVVIAIDFGSSCSGFAFVFPQDISETVYCTETWGGSCSINVKTLTQIVLDENKKFVAFGYEARDYFSNNEEEDTEKHSLYSFYKMHLFNPKTRGQPIKSVCGNDSATIQELITESLRFLKSAAMDKVNSISSKKVFETEVQWVLTIPAIWDDSSKQVMRSCADTAGLCSKDDRDSLIFSYEPEAGALQCIFEKTTGYSVQVGEKFMVIDNGGGTSDIICYEQLEGGKLKSISRSFGGDFGSSYVNNNFILFLKKLFGDDVIESRKKTTHFQSLFDRFEFLKKTYNRESNHIISLEFFPMTLFHEDENWLTKKIQEFNSKSGFNLRYSSAREKLIFPNDLFISFFKPLFQSITDSIKSEMESNSDIKKLDYIFLIGGFNENKDLQEHIKSELEFTGSTFVIPNKAGLSVVMGATRFGLNPNTISTRKQTKSYATEITEVITPSKPHTGKSIIKIRDIPHCQNVCDVFVHANQMVGCDEVFTRSYVPTSQDQKAIEISIFSSHMPTMSYTTDPGVQFIGELYVDIPNVGAPVNENRIDVTLKFASTEIEVYTLHVKSRKEIRHSYDFALDEAESLRRNRLRQEKNKPPMVQLCLMMDCTGSMGSWIKESKEKIISLTGLLANSYVGLELNASFIGYRDITDSNRFEVVPFTTDMGYLASKINEVVPIGGGDTPEDIAGAFLQVNNLSWKPNHTKLVVHIGDAPCHGKQYHNCDDSYPDGDPSGLVPEKLLQTLSSKSVDYYFIKITSETDKMIDIFRKSYDSSQKKIVVQDLGSDVSKLLPSLVNFVQTSITRFTN
ncbi:hypothetical protein ACTFIW_011652 [Dictyostelium discoideum]